MSLSFVLFNDNWLLVRIFSVMYDYTISLLANHQSRYGLLIQLLQIVLSIFFRGSCVCMV